MTAPAPDTTDRLLAAIRRQAGIEHLAWRVEPRPLTGGFWAETYLVELADPPGSLAGPLVARVMPDPAVAAFETAIQRHVHQHGLGVPAVRAACGPTEELERAWTLMDLAPGRPLLDGLTAAGAIRKVPTLARRLPDLLATAAADLHRCPTEGLGPALGRQAERADVTAFCGRLAQQATAIERPDLAAVARRLGDDAPPERVICHGDLHPFNLLVDERSWALIDWSAAVLADPHFDLGFATLVLANPPLGGPPALRRAARAIGSRLANRFLRTYERRSGRAVDPERLRWGRALKALGATIELTTWEAHGLAGEHRGHPWFALRSTMEAELSPYRPRP